MSPRLQDMRPPRLAEDLYKFAALGSDGLWHRTAVEARSKDAASDMHFRGLRPSGAAWPTGRCGRKQRHWREVTYRGGGLLEPTVGAGMAACPTCFPEAE